MTHNSPLRIQALETATRAVHAGEHNELGDAKPTSNPIYLNTAFSYPSAEALDEAFGAGPEGYVYSRYGNPSVHAFEAAIAALEETDGALAYSSGMAAIQAVFATHVSAGDSVIVSRDVYGATHALLSKQFAPHGVDVHFVDILDLDAVAALAERTQPAVIFAESISNPLLRVTDIPGLAAISKRAGAQLVIDNTFPSPALLQPIKLGADAVVHSTTKFIAGHGDVTGGVAAASEAFISKLFDHQSLSGAIAQPFDSWLALRGLKTLHLRMREHSKNAQVVVDWLRQDERIGDVYYPGSHQRIPDGIPTENGLGAMLAFEIAGAGRTEVFRYLDSLKLVQPAPSLGDIYSLTLYPPISSHRALTPEQRAEVGMSDSLVRLSVGIEDAADIIADLDQAISAATAEMAQDPHLARREVPAFND